MSWATATRELAWLLGGVLRQPGTRHPIKAWGMHSNLHFAGSMFDQALGTEETCIVQYMLE